MTEQPLRVALLTYRGNPFCGGQGVYVRNLSRHLVGLGHSVDVLSGQPYPELDDGVRLVPVPSLDLYREPDPFRVPRWREYRDWIDCLEVATMLTGGFPEPLTYSLRARRLLRSLPGRYDVVHDNQTLGYGLAGLPRMGLPLVTTIHHPVQIDREIELSAAAGVRRLSLRRWYAFTRMQRRVAGSLRDVITVSQASRASIVEHLGVPADRIRVIPIGTDIHAFSPSASVPKVPGRIVTTASADSPLKGVVPLLEAVAKVRTEHHAELVLVGAAGSGRHVSDAIERYGLAGTVRLTGRLPREQLIHELRSAEVAVVPSLFEGFSLPLVEAMACGTAVVSSTAGALPEVAGTGGETALLVPPGDPQALAGAIGQVLADPALRERLARNGRARACARYSLRRAAEQTVSAYRAAMAGTGGGTAGAPSGAGGR